MQRSVVSRDRENARRICGGDPSVRQPARREAIMVIMITAVILLSGKSMVGKFMSKTKNIGWETPPDSESVIAKNHANSFFPKRMKGAIVVAVEALPGTTSVLTTAVADFSRNLSSRVSLDSRVSSYDPIVVGYYLDVLGYHPPTNLLEKELVSPDKQMTVIFIQPTKMDGNWDDANAFLMEFCAAPPAGYTLHITGMVAVLNGNGCFAGVHAKVNTKDMNFESLGLAEACTLPVALLIMGYIVKYLRLLLIPTLIVMTAFVVASAALVPFMDKVGIPKDTPAAMGSVILAMSLDYSLFILARFAENHMENLPLQENIDRIQRRTCRTICVSGSLVSIAFFGSVLMPERNMQGTGFCLGFASLACVAVSCTLTPAILLLTGKFFTKTSFVPARFGDVQLHGYIEDDELHDSSPISKQRVNQFWLHVARVVDFSPVAAILMVLCCMGPLLYYLPQMNVTADAFAMLPMDMPAISALHRIQDVFPMGVLDPFAIVITAPEQGDASELNSELQAGAGVVGKHDVRAAASQMGLSPHEAVAFEAAVTGINSGGPATSLENKLDPATLAAVSAGAALRAQKADGASDADSVKAAVRAAAATGCGSLDMQAAVGAAVVSLYPKGKEIPSSLEGDVKSEALKSGLDQAAAIDLAVAVARSVHGDDNLNPSTLAAAQAGAATGMARLHGQSTTYALKAALLSLDDVNIPPADVAKVMRAVYAVHQAEGATAAAGSSLTREVPLGKAIVGGGLSARAVDIIATALTATTQKADLPSSVEKPSGLDVAASARHVGSVASQATNVQRLHSQTKLPVILDLVEAVSDMSAGEHGMLLMPTGYAAVLDLCDAVQDVGNVASFLGHTWVLHQRIDWAMALALNVNASIRSAYRPLRDSHVNGRTALLEVHTTFPSIGAGGANWVGEVRRALATWEDAHPGYHAELSGGAAETADSRNRIMESVWPYLSISSSIIILVVYVSFRSLMIPLRLVFALFFTLSATFGAGTVIYQTSLLHPLFPSLKYYHGISYQVVPLVGGVAIALGLDYDIFLVSRIVEFRLSRFTDRASIFRGVLKTGEVISGAGIIMALAFTGLVFSNKLLFQQFGVLLIASVLFDTFVVRTVLVPALMLLAQKWNWWPRVMPPPIHDVLEGEVESSGGLSKPILAGIALSNDATSNSSRRLTDDLFGSGMIA